jgi:hypothetical protein
MEEQLSRLEGYIQAMELIIEEGSELDSEDQLMNLYNEVQYILEDLKYSPSEDPKKEKELLKRFKIVCSQFETPDERLKTGLSYMSSKNEDDFDEYED